MWAHRVTKAAVGSVVMCSVLAVTAGANAAVPSTASVTRKVLAPGVVYRRIVDPAGPWIVHMLKVDPGSSATVDPVLAGSTVGSYATTSSIGIGAGAIAAINGDFGGRFGLPTHTFVSDGSPVTSGMFPGASFGLRSDKTGAGISDTALLIRATDRTGTARGIRVMKWNVGSPSGNQVRGYTPFGGSSLTPPKDACSVRLSHTSKLRWDKKTGGVLRDYRVKVRRCGAGAMQVRAGTVVLSSKRTGAGADWIGSLARRGVVRLSWAQGTPRVLDAVGGYPHLVRAGRVLPAACDSYICRQHPRAAIGVTGGGAILLVVVDGRKSTSVGMTPRQLAGYMRALGARDALNLDGGGGATMWIAGMGVVNDPTDGRERAVTNAVVILPGADAGEPVPLGLRAGLQRTRASAIAGPGVALAGDVARDRAIAAAMADPASTGGLADLLMRQLGDPSAVDPAILRIAARFREAR